MTERDGRKAIPLFRTIRWPLSLAILFGICFPMLARAEDAWALIIGIQSYAYKPGLNNLAYPESDATDLRAALVKSAAFRQDHIRLLLSPQATQAAIEEGLSWLAKSAKANDLVLVYFSGHGSYIPDKSKKDGYATCLVDHAVKCIRGDEVIAALSHIRSTRKVLIADACFAGGLVRTIHQKPGARTRDLKAAPWLVKKISGDPAFTTDTALVPPKELRPSGLLVLVASRFNQRSWEVPEFGHGVFTEFLLRGLAGVAKDLDGDGYISVEEIFHYIDEQLALVRYGTNPLLQREYFGDILQEPLLIRGDQAQDVRIMRTSH